MPAAAPGAAAEAVPSSATARRRLGGRRPVAPGSGPVLGVPLALTDYDRTMDWIDARIERGERGYVSVATVHLVMRTHEDADLRRGVLESSLTVPDGQPLVWAINALGHDPPSRVYGPELMARYCERAARTGTRMFLSGGATTRNGDL